MVDVLVSEEYRVDLIEPETALPKRSVDRPDPDPAIEKDDVVSSTDKERVPGTPAAQTLH
jgi:hypothetical protein